MFERLSSTRPAACLSDLRLDAYLAEDVSPEEAGAVRAHLAHCSRCQARLEALGAVRAHYLTRPEAVSFGRDLALRTSPERGPTGAFPRSYALGAVLAVAAALLLLVWPRNQPAHQLETRLKGGERFGFYVHHAGRTRRGSDGERTTPGDLLRFTYSTERAAQFAVLSYDPAKHASVYVPFMSVAPGVNLAAPLSVELDASLGSELLYGLFCAQRPAVAELLRVLEQRAGAPPVAPGCEVFRLQIMKVASD
ncbi:MAG TPA: zf-HC2 domain-containing protein [Polyangiales bacterium]